MPFLTYICKNPTPHKTKVFIPASVMGSPSPSGTGGSVLSSGGGILSAPVQTALSTETTGGTLAAKTYYVVVTAVNANGETVASNEEHQATTGSTSTLTVSWGAVQGAASYNIYVGDDGAGSESVVSKANTGTSLTLDALPGTDGTPPSSNTATYSGVSSVGSQAVITCPLCSYTAQAGDGMASSVAGGAQLMDQEHSISKTTAQPLPANQSAPLASGTPDSAVRVGTQGIGGTYNLNSQGKKNLL